MWQKKNQEKLRTVAANRLELTKEDHPIRHPTAVLPFLPGERARPHTAMLVAI